MNFHLVQLLHLRVSSYFAGSPRKMKDYLLPLVQIKQSQSKVLLTMRKEGSLLVLSLELLTLKFELASEVDVHAVEIRVGY